MLDLDSGDSNDSGLLFRSAGQKWIYNLSARSLATGTFVLTVEMPDGLRYRTTFALR